MKIQTMNNKLKAKNRKGQGIAPPRCINLGLIIVSFLFFSNVYAINRTLAQAGGKTGEEAIIHAVYTGDYATVEQFLKSAVSFSLKSNYLLHEEDENTIIPKSLQQQFYSGNIGFHEMNFLYIAAREGHTDIVKLFYNHKVDINMTTYFGRGLGRSLRKLKGITALSAASANNHIGIVKFLIDNGAEIDTKAGFAETPLMWAAANGHTEVVKILIDRGADVNALPRLYNNNHFFTLNEMKEDNTADPGPLNSHPALILAAMGGYIDIVKLILEAGGDINIQDRYSNTALKLASANGYADIVNLLLSKNAKINIANFACKTALISAAENGKTDIVKLLLEHGAETRFKGMASNSAQLLLKHNIDTRLSYKNNPLYDWNSALTAAAANGHTDIVRLLFDKHDKGHNYKAMLRASQEGHLKIVEFLMENGLDLNEAAKDWLCMSNAIRYGHIEIVKLFLEHGIYGVYIFKNGERIISKESAISTASFYGHDDIVALLQGFEVNIEKLYMEEFQILDPACEDKTECAGEYLVEREILDNKTNKKVSVVDVNEEKISNMNVIRNGIVTDGVTRLVLQIKANQVVKFVIVPLENSDRISQKFPWGTLSEYNRERQNPESIEIGYEKGDGYVYALYRSPANFPLKTLKMPVYITIKAIAKTTGEVIEKKIQLLPPPVILVHGLWSKPKKWKEGEIGPESTLSGIGYYSKSFFTILKDNGFDVYLVNYHLKSVSTSTFNPQYKSYSIGQLIAETNGVLNKYREKNIAITQVDVVGHSMGGLITRARTVYKYIPFKKISNYKRGDFHKIITIGTPHQGSPIANVLVECKDATSINCEYNCKVDTDCYRKCRYDCLHDSVCACERKCLICPEEGFNCVRNGWLKLSKALELELWFNLKDSTPIGEAVYDLQVGSDAINLIPKTIIPSHAIVGRKSKVFNSWDENGQNIAFSLFDIEFKADKSPVKIDKLLGKHHDSIVSERSQKGGLSNNQVTIIEDIIHTNEPLSNGVRKNTVRLLLKEEIKLSEMNKTLLPVETEMFGFFKPFQVKLKTKLTTCDGLPKEIKWERMVSNASISYEPLPGTIEKQGEKSQLKLNLAIGATHQLVVTGKYPDGSEVDITSSMMGTIYSMKNHSENIITVSKDGLIKAQKNGEDVVIIKNGGHFALINVIVGSDFFEAK